jgi:hypothetical protein
MPKELTLDNPPGMLKNARLWVRSTKTYQNHPNPNRRRDVDIISTLEEFNNLTEEEAKALLNRPRKSNESQVTVWPSVTVERDQTGYFCYTPWVHDPCWTKERIGSDRLTLCEVLDPQGFCIVSRCVLPFGMKFKMGYGYAKWLCGTDVAYANDPAPYRGRLRFLCEDRPVRNISSETSDRILRALRAQKLEEQRKLPEPGGRRWVRS